MTLAAVGVALAPAAAHAANGSIRSAVAHDGKLDIVFSTAGTVRAVDPGKIRVTIDGRAVTSTATTVDTTAQTPAVEPGAVEAGTAATLMDRSAILAIDTSGSMNGARLAGAKHAALAFLASVPADVRVGLVSFADDARTLVTPTTDRSAVTREVGRLRARGGTSLYDAVLLASRELGSSGDRRIVVLSDGADSTSRASLAATVAAVRGSGVTVTAVATGVDGAGTSALRLLAKSGQGRVLAAASTADATAAFAGAAREFSATLFIHAVLAPENAGSTVRLKVQVPSGSATLSDETAVEVPGVPPLAEGRSGKLSGYHDGWFGSRESLGWAIAALFVGLVALLWLAVYAGDSRAQDERRTRQLLTSYTLEGAGRPQQAAEDTGAAADSAIARSALEMAGRIVKKRGAQERLELALDRAALPLRPEEWVLLRATVAVVGVVVAWLLLHSLLLGVFVGGVAGFAGPRVFLGLRAARRLNAFRDSLPDALQLVAGGLSTGYSLPQALDGLTREGAEPVAGEVGRALAEARLGVPVEDALESVADRMDSVDFRWVVMAIRVQRDVGGNLAGVLTTVCHTLRDRARLRRQVRTLSAEGRLSAWVLIGLPLVLGLYEYAFRRDYFRPMYTTSFGIMMLVVTVVSMTVGAVWMQKLVKVEV